MMQLRTKDETIIAHLDGTIGKKYNYEYHTIEYQK